MITDKELLEKLENLKNQFINDIKKDLLGDDYRDIVHVITKIMEEDNIVDYEYVTDIRFDYGPYCYLNGEKTKDYLMTDKYDELKWILEDINGPKITDERFIDYIFDTDLKLAEQIENIDNEIEYLSVKVDELQEQKED